MPQLGVLPRQSSFISGVIAPSSVLRFYQTGTSTPQNAYTDAALSNAVTSLTADSAGLFAKWYLNPNAAADYRYTLETSAGSVYYTEDNISRIPFSQDDVGAALYPRADAEIAAGVTPTSKAYPEYEWPRYGAVNDGATDNQPILQTVMEALLAEGVQTFDVPAGTFKFNTPLAFDTDSPKLHLRGTSMAGEFGNTTTESRITGANGSDAILEMGGVLYSLEVEHLTFESASSTTGVVSAILSSAESGPARPINIHHNTFLTFEKAIASVVSSGGLNTGMCNLHINYNVFQGGEYALFAEGDINSIMNLDFSNNVSEQGGRIRIEDNGLGGSFNITNNLLEGQSDPVYITAGTANGCIERNYFEGNTGTIISFSSSSGAATLRMAGNIYVGNNKVEVNNCYLDCIDDVGLYANQLLNKSKVRSQVFYSSNVSAGFINNLDFGVATYQRAAPVSLSGALYRPGPLLAETPLGVKGYEEFTTNSSLYRVAQSLASGDMVVVTALIKSVNATTVQVLVYDESNVQVGASSVLPMNGIGEYTLIHAAVPVTAATTGYYKVRFAVDSTKIAWAMDFYSYKQASPATDTALYLYYPTMAAGGVATIALNDTSVAVTHALPIAVADSTSGPNITLTSTVNVGNMWITNVSDSGFTINCSSNSHAASSVYWKME